MIIGESGVDRASIPPDVRYIELSGKPTLGAKRNAGCDAARGELIAHWDDDDYSAPGRLADQVARIRASGKPVTGYRVIRFTDGHDWWQYSGSLDYAVGTSLVYRRDWWQGHKFQAVDVEEDNMFVAQARAHGAIVSADAGDLMFATIHAGNTSPRRLSGKAWTRL